MTASQGEVHEQLRAWAQGLYSLEAATELLIRAFGGRFVQPEWPWIHSTAHGYWIDFATIPVQIGGLSGGERRLLRIAASMGCSEASINLSDSLSGLDHPRLQLVLTAVAHAAGSPDDRDAAIGHDTSADLAPNRRWTPGSSSNASGPIRRSL